MNQQYELLILSALAKQNHNITTLMQLLNIDNSHLQDFSTIISNLAGLEYIDYQQDKLCLTTKGSLQQQTLFNEWKQTNNILVNIFKGTNNE